MDRWEELAKKTAESHAVCERHGIKTSDGSLAVDCNSTAAALLNLESQLARVRQAATYAAAELRHAYREQVIDRNLVARAIEALEQATTAEATSSTLARAARIEAAAREVVEAFSATSGSGTGTNIAIFVNKVRALRAALNEGRE